mmetsp:Transcript_90038/g.157283  ORF Transcript_90038/g.157283 Transcript_90038/m.157283 type:complete len:268 (-) Transcript_90038:89-892(-)
MSALCSVHNKNRTLPNLEPDGQGGYQCTGSSKCQQTGEKRGAMDMAQMNQMYRTMQMMMAQANFSGGKKARQTPDSGVVVCSVHNKSRSLKSMTDDGYGGMCCAPGYECQIGSSDGSGSKKAEGVCQVCSVHGKKRSPQSLVSDGAGGMCCAPGMTCQLKTTDDDAGGATEQHECSVHGKMRSMQSLVEDGQGGYKCSPGMQCQMGGFPKGKSGSSKMPPGMMNPMMMMMMQQMRQMSVGGKGGGRGKGKGSKTCKWCMQGECWTHS